MNKKNDPESLIFWTAWVSENSLPQCKAFAHIHPFFPRFLESVRSWLSSMVLSSSNARLKDTEDREPITCPTPKLQLRGWQKILWLNWCHGFVGKWNPNAVQSNSCYMRSWFKWQLAVARGISISPGFYGESVDKCSTCSSGFVGTPKCQYSTWTNATHTDLNRSDSWLTPPFPSLTVSHVRVDMIRPY